MEVNLLLTLRAASSAASVNNGSDTYPGAFPPPPGVTPNLEDPKDAGRIANIVGLVICDVLVTLLFATRVWVKFRITRNILVEDITCAIAWACILLYSAAVFLMVKYGEGHHSWDISPGDYSRMLKWLYASSIIYCPTAYFTKVTLLLLIARVFAIKTGVSRALHIFIIGLLVAYLPIQAVKIVICYPIRSYWNPSVNGHCLQQRKVFISDLCLAIIADLVILIVPIPLTWKLRMPWQRKLKIVILLSAGGVATATTIFRLYKVIEFQKSKDVASDFILLDLLTIIEVTIGVICACLPAANILYEHHFGKHPSAPSRNSPRSWKTYQRKDRLVWGGLGATMSRHLQSSSTEALPTRKTDHNTLAMSEATETNREIPPNFDLELAMLTRGSDSQEAGSRPASISQPLAKDRSHSEQHWFVVERANSSDGVREGWLSPKARGSGINDSKATGCTSTGATASTSRGDTEEHSKEEKQTPESRTPEMISMELARVSGNRPWTRIWDGKTNSPATSP